MSAVRDCSLHGEWVDDRTTVGCPECIAERDYLVSILYTPEGIEKWLAHARAQGWSLEEQVRRLTALADGAFS